MLIDFHQVHLGNTATVKTLRHGLQVVSFGELQCQETCEQSISSEGVKGKKALSWLP